MLLEYLKNFLFAADSQSRLIEDLCRSLQAPELNREHSWQQNQLTGALGA